MEFEYGEKIKATREEKGLSLGDVSFDLKININTLKKIEASNTEDLPKAPFTKGFIRTYCLYLKLSPDLVLEAYEQTLKEPSTKLNKGILSTDEGAGAFFAFDFFRTKLLPLGILSVMVLGATATYSYLKKGRLGVYSNQKTTSNRTWKKNASKGESFITPVADPTEAEKKVEAAREKAVQKPEKLMRLATVYKGGKILDGNKVKEEVKENVETKSPEKKQEPVVFKNALVVEPLAETYLYIKTNLDKKYIRATLKPDVLRKFKFDNATIRFLDAGAVNLIFNGEDVGALGLFGEEKTIQFPSMKEL